MPSFQGRFKDMQKTLCAMLPLLDSKSISFYHWKFTYEDHINLFKNHMAEKIATGVEASSESVCSNLDPQGKGGA